MEINALIFYPFALLLLVASVIDLKYRYVPDWVHLGILVLFACSLFCPPPALSPGSRFLGALTTGGIMLLVSLLTRGGIGGGDIKLMAASGLLLGFPGAFLAMLMAYLIAGLCFLIPLLTGKLDKKAEIPMIPFFAASLLLSAAFGNRILFWYLRLFLDFS